MLLSFHYKLDEKNLRKIIKKKSKKFIAAKRKTKKHETFKMKKKLAGFAVASIRKSQKMTFLEGQEIHFFCPTEKVIQMRKLSNSTNFAKTRKTYHNYEKKKKEENK